MIDSVSQMARERVTYRDAMYQKRNDAKAMLHYIFLVCQEMTEI